MRYALCPALVKIKLWITSPNVNKLAV